MKSILFTLCLLICQPLLASGGALRPIGPYGIGVMDTQTKQTTLRVYYPTQKVVDTPTLENLPIFQSQFPVLLFIPDKKKTSLAYEDLIIQLVSHGYIVIGINHALIKNSLSNLLYVRKMLDEKMGPLSLIYGHIQLKHVGLLGSSKGAAVAARAIKTHPELFEAIASIHAAIGSEIENPFLQLLDSSPELKNTKLRDNNFVIQLKSNSNDNDQLIDYYVLQFFDMYLKGIISHGLAYCLSISNDLQLACGGYNPRLKSLSSLNLLKVSHHHPGPPFLGSYFH